MTDEQVVRSIIHDFRQYEPQILLFCEIIRLLSDGETIVKRTPGKDNGIWIRMRDQRNMRWIGGQELVDYMCASINTASMPPEMLAAVASRVFQTRVVPAIDPNFSAEGFLLETGMAGFKCCQCGHCCQSLDYQNEITAEDVKGWQDAGRTDILEWVGVFRGDNQETIYQIWVTPGTRQVADTCPFLKKEARTKRQLCRIHDAKPAICRQYPVGRKHARMTGCPGFDKK